MENAIPLNFLRLKSVLTFHLFVYQRSSFLSKSIRTLVVMKWMLGIAAFSFQFDSKRLILLSDQRSTWILLCSLCALMGRWEDVSHRPILSSAPLTVVTDITSCLRFKKHIIYDCEPRSTNVQLLTQMNRSKREHSWVQNNSVGQRQSPSTHFGERAIVCVNIYRKFAITY